MCPRVGGWGGERPPGPGAGKGVVLTRSDRLSPGQREEEAGGELGPAPTAGRHRDGGRREGRDSPACQGQR